MALTRITVKMNRASGVAKDASVNVFHVVSPDGVTSDNAAGWAADLNTFYDTCAIYLSGVITRATNAHTMEFANVTKNTPGADDDVVSPVGITLPWTLTGAGAGANLPSELAVCLSWRGVGALSQPEEGAGNSRPRSQRRGRTYLGPINTAALAENTGTGICRLAGGAMVTFVEAQEALVAGLNSGASQCLLGIYSPTSGQFSPVDHMHVDNAFDIIRSRGELATNRAEGVADQGGLISQGWTF